jgi:ABC-2 type transport system permease protein
MKGLAKLTWNEMKLFRRDPVTAFFALAFPTLLLVILGRIPGFQEPNPLLGGVRAIQLYVPIMLVFAMGMLGLQSLPLSLATYREKGILRRLAVTPLRPIRLIGAQMQMNLLLGLGAVATMLAIGRIAFDVSLPRQLFGFVLAFMLMAAALFAIGLTIAAVAPSGKAASAGGTFLFFPLMFFAGLWIPRAVMPATLRQIGDFTPLGAGVQALQDAAAGMWPHPLHLIVLTGYVLVFGTIASVVFRWE